MGFRKVALSHLPLGPEVGWGKGGGGAVRESEEGQGRLRLTVGQQRALQWPETNQQKAREQDRRPVSQFGPCATKWGPVGT